jgi:ubiquinone/menaquinone biosynthesis C-methylase UbiE
MSRHARSSEREGPSTFRCVLGLGGQRENKRVKRMRRDVTGGARGRVLEVGVGVGANWPYLSEGIDYTGVEPDPYMIERANRHAAEAGKPREVLKAPAEALPFPDDEFDTVIVTLTLCTVSDPQQALSEVRRVLKPGGELRFAEHVRPAGRLAGRLSDLITPAWRRIGAGCHPNRRTADAIRAAGFEMVEFQKWREGLVPMIAGVARSPD